MDYEQLFGSLGVEVYGFSLVNVSNDQKKILRRLLAENGLLVIRNCDLNPEELIAFSEIFGSISSYTRPEFSLDDHPGILVLSNIEKNNKPIGSAVSGRAWHLDGHYLENIPNHTILNMKTLQQEGGDTYFTNMQRAYEELPCDIKSDINDLDVVISRVKSRPFNYPKRGKASAQQKLEWKDVIHPLVMTHPQTQKKSLAVGGNVPWDIKGRNQYESIALITFLQEWVIAPKFVYRHVWRDGDLLIWDNKVVMHKASPYIGERLLYRTTTNLLSEDLMPVRATN